MLLRTPHDIGSLIKAHRLSLHLSQSDLADQVGVSRLWVVQTERGNPGASLELVLRTLATLGVTLSSDAGKPSDAPPAESHDLAAVLEIARRR